MRFGCFHEPARLCPLSHEKETHSHAGLDAWIFRETLIQKFGMRHRFRCLFIFQIHLNDTKPDIHEIRVEFHRLLIIR